MQDAAYLEHLASLPYSRLISSAQLNTSRVVSGLRQHYSWSEVERFARTAEQLVNELARRDAGSQQALFAVPVAPDDYYGVVS